MEETTYKKVMIGIWCIIILVMVYIAIGGKEKPNEGYEFKYQCVFWLGQNNCQYFNQESQLCHSECDFTQAPKNLSVNQIDSYCKQNKLTVCQRYVKVMDYVLSS